MLNVLPRKIFRQKKILIQKKNFELRKFLIQKKFLTAKIILTKIKFLTQKKIFDLKKKFRRFFHHLPCNIHEYFKKYKRGKFLEIQSKFHVLLHGLFHMDYSTWIPHGITWTHGLFYEFPSSFLVFCLCIHEKIYVDFSLNFNKNSLFFFIKNHVSWIFPLISTIFPCF